jgi:ubiquinone/menaquinone biosynthesis C-methylase UbiE
VNCKIYESLGPAGIQNVDFSGNTVNILWFRRTNEYLKQIYEKKQFNCLELGAGAGGPLVKFKHDLPLMNAYASDIYVPAVIEGKKLFSNINFAACDGCNLSFSDNRFGSVIIHDVLEHVENPIEMLKEAYRVLKPGGFLHLFVPCEGQPGTVHALFRNNPKEKHGHIQNFRRKEIINMLGQTGFVIKTRQDSFHLAGQIADIMSYCRVNYRSKYINKIGAWVVGTLARIGYVESKLMVNYPGLCLEIVAIK